MLSFAPFVKTVTAGRLRFLVGTALLTLVVSGCTPTDSPLFVRGPQRRLYIGPTVGLGVNSPSGSFHSQTAAYPDCGGFNGGSNTGLGFGLSMDYWFQQKLSSNGIILRAMMQNMPGEFTNDYGGVLVLNPLTGKPSPVAESNVASVDYTLIAARLAYVYMVPNMRLGIEVGPSIGVATKLGVTQKLQLSGSPDASFGNGSADSVIYDGSPSSKNGLRFGIWAGAEYRFDVGWWIIAPFLGIDLGLTKVMTTDSWSMTSIMAGVDIRYGIK